MVDNEIFLSQNKDFGNEHIQLDLVRDESFFRRHLELNQERGSAFYLKLEERVQRIDWIETGYKIKQFQYIEQLLTKYPLVSGHNP